MGERETVLPVAALEKLTARRDAEAALLYVHIAACGGFFLRRAARELGRSEDAVRASAAVLRELGLLRERQLPSRELPEYTAADVVIRSRTDGGFEAMVEAAQQQLGRLLSTAELKTLIGIYDHLGLPAEVIYLLIGHCIETYRQRSGEGRMPTMRYIEKEAHYWAEQEILTLEAADEHIRREAERRSTVSQAAAVLQIRGRDLSPGERKYIEAWLDMGFGIEALELAYDRTVIGTGKLAWKYMDKILSSWNSKGLHTPAEIASGDARRTGEAKPAAAQPKPGEDAELEELRRLHAYLKNKEN